MVVCDHDIRSMVHRMKNVCFYPLNQFPRKTGLTRPGTALTLSKRFVMVADDHVHCPLIEPNLFHMNIRERLSFICTV